MEGGGYFRGTSKEQDSRFSDKEKKLLQSSKFPPEYSTKVDMKNVKLEVIKPWITQKLNELLGFEDEVLIGYVFSLLEEIQNPDPKQLQINISGFLEKDASAFVLEMWKLLISAQNNHGIPPEILEKKKDEIKRKKAEHDRIQAELQKKKEIQERIKKIPNYGDLAEQRFGSDISALASANSNTGQIQEPPLVGPNPLEPIITQNRAKVEHKKYRTTRRDSYDKEKDESERDRHERHKKRKRSRSPNSRRHRSRSPRDRRRHSSYSRSPSPFKVKESKWDKK